MYPEENKIYEDAYEDLDKEFLDQLYLQDDDSDEWDFSSKSLIAAGEGADPGKVGDGIDTPANKAARANVQLRDKSGKFAKMGGRVIIGGNSNYQGNIRSMDAATQTVKVELNNGNTVDIPASMTEPAEAYVPIPNAVAEGELDTSGILGEPRTPMDSPIRMPGTLPPLNAQNLNLMLTNYPQWVSEQRLSPDVQPNQTQSGTAPTSGNTPTSAPARSTNPLSKYYPQTITPEFKSVNAYNVKVLKNWLESDKSGIRTAPPFMDPAKNKKYIEEKGTKKSSWLDSQGRVLKASAENNLLTPETSDVPILHMAIVSPDDPQAVMDLVALHPATKDTIEPTTYSRNKGKWVHDPQILLDLKSATPPPVIVLDDATLIDVIEQIDNKAITAAGGADRNRGQAEKLRRYWTYGKGAAKIRWKTPGDWTRCYRQLAKYMGPRAKGYCALRHKEMNGYWPGDKKNQEMGAFTVNTLRDYDELLSTFIMRAKAADARARVMTAGGEIENQDGAEFSIPLVIPEEVESGDGRVIIKDALSIRELPLPLLWQIQTGEGHNGSVVVGRIVSMERVDGGIGNAKGFFDKGSYAQEAERLVRGGFIRGAHRGHHPAGQLRRFRQQDRRRQQQHGSRGGGQAPAARGFGRGPRRLQPRHAEDRRAGLPGAVHGLPRGRRRGRPQDRRRSRLGGAHQDGLRRAAEFVPQGQGRDGRPGRRRFLRPRSRPRRGVPGQQERRQVRRAQGTRVGSPGGERAQLRRLRALPSPGRPRAASCFLGPKLPHQPAARRR
jgi:hypothetical protein